jgi:hypothetical protein
MQNAVIERNVGSRGRQVTVGGGCICPDAGGDERHQENYTIFYFTLMSLWLFSNSFSTLILFIITFTFTF